MQLLTAAPHKLVFFGLDGPYSVVTLEALVKAGFAVSLVICGIDKKGGPSFSLARPGRRSGRPGPSSTVLSDVANGLGLEAVTTFDPSALRARAKLKSISADAFVVAGFHRLLPRSVLELSRLGGLNLHPGKLPEQRGPSPLFWVLRDGKTALDFSIHLLDEGEDTGDIVHTGRVSFEPGLDGQEILKRCAVAATPLLVRAVRDLLREEIVRSPQPRGTFQRAARPSFSDGKIEADRPAVEVFTFVAGCAKHYSLFVEAGGDRFFIRGATSYDPEGSLSVEYCLLGDRLLLRCQPGVVELTVKEDGALFTAEYADPQ